MHPGKQAPREMVRFVDKIVVFYLAEDEETYLWQLIPRAEIGYIDQGKYLFFVNWPLDNYVYSGWWGRKVSERMMSIYNAVIGWLVRVGKAYHLNARNRERAASVRAIRRQVIKRLSRYCNGAMLTPIFRNFLDRFLSAITNNVSVTIQARQLDGLKPVTEFVC